MDAPSILPPEVLAYIADILGADIDAGLMPQLKRDSHTIRALKMLCLSCKFMVAVCRRHLFSKISLSSLSSLKRRRTLSVFLLLHPVIPRHYVKTLYLDTSRHFEKSGYDLLKALCESSSLFSIQLNQPYDH